MEFSLFAAGHSLDNGKPTQRAACAAVLIAREGDRTKYREISHYLESTTGPQSELQAAYMALAAVQPRWRSELIILTVGSYPNRMLERAGDGWATNAKSNEQLVGRLRTLINQFPRLTISSRAADEFTRAGELARISAQAQTQSDTGSEDRDTGGVRCG